MTINQKFLAAGIATVAVLGAATGVAAKETGRIKADSMVGVPASMTGQAGAIRGVNGGGLPWAIGEAEASVKASGKVEISFEGLVFAAGQNTGKNTLATMNAIVSCLDAENHPVNVATGPFPVTVATADSPGGDGHVETRLELPNPCIAPIVMVTNAAGTVWLAVDGL